MIDYLKMDIEGTEWEVLSSFVRQPAANRLLSQSVRQVGFEIHTNALTLRKEIHSTLMWSGGRPNAVALKHMHLTLGNFERNLGFRRWSFHFNHHCAYSEKTLHVRSFCYELVYINTKFIKSEDLTTNFPTSR